MQEKTFVDGLKAATATGLGYTSIGLAFGIIAAASGLSVIEVALLSFFIYGGTAQFAVVAMLVTGESLFSIVTTIFFINLRNLLMGLHVATLFPKASLLEGILMGTFLADESYGVLLGEKVHTDAIGVKWMYGNNIVGYITWCSATVAGTLLGTFIPNPQQFGLDFALVAMFIGIFSGQLLAILRTVAVKKIAWVLLATLVAYLGLSMLVMSSLAVLLATLIGCGVGVYLDEQ